MVRRPIKLVVTQSLTEIFFFQEQDVLVKLQPLQTTPSAQLA